MHHIIKHHQGVSSSKCLLMSSMSRNSSHPRYPRVIKPLDCTLSNCGWLQPSINLVLTIMTVHEGRVCVFTVDNLQDYWMTAHSLSYGELKQTSVSSLLTWIFDQLCYADVYYVQVLLLLLLDYLCNTSKLHLSWLPSKQRKQPKTKSKMDCHKPLEKFRTVCCKK